MSKEPSRVDENGLMHSISYAAQSPWLRHQSIKDYILFIYMSSSMILLAQWYEKPSESSLLLKLMLNTPLG